MELRGLSHVLRTWALKSPQIAPLFEDAQIRRNQIKDVSVSSWVLVWMLLLAGTVVFWRGSRMAAEAAFRAAKNACEQTSVQLLDQSVAFRRFDWSKGVFKRVYTFDYCPNGLERFRGMIWMRGLAVDTVAFDASANGVLMTPPSDGAGS